MVKRVSVLFSTALRAEMSVNMRVGASKGMREALHFVHEFFTLVANPCAVFEQSSHGRIRCLDVTSPGRDDLQDAISKGSRATVVISRSLFKYIRVEINIYANGRKQAIGAVLVSFDQVDGKCSAESQLFKR